MIAFSAGVKTAMGGGGYGVLAVMGSGNTGLSEGSTLATVCIMMLPLMLFIYKHSVIFAGFRFYKTALIGTATTLVLATFGTGARTGLVVTALLVVLLLSRSKRKWLLIPLVLACAAVASNMDLINSLKGNRSADVGSFGTESSSLGRIAVWKWTLGYVASNPLGGGFDAFKFNDILDATENGIIHYPPGVFAGKAYHNLFFEVLGEQGIVGITAYLGMILITLIKLTRIRQRFKTSAESAWAADLALALRDSMFVLLVGGMFIGIAYQAYIFYIIALGVALSQVTAKFSHTR